MSIYEVRLNHEFKKSIPHFEENDNPVKHILALCSIWWQGNQGKSERKSMKQCSIDVLPRYATQCRITAKRCFRASCCLIALDRPGSVGKCQDMLHRRGLHGGKITHAAVDAKNETIIKCTKADERRINGCVNIFKTHVSTSIESFDCDPDTLNCRNGVLDLRAGMLEPHTRSQRFTYCLPVEYGPSDCSEWLDYLNGVIGGGQEVIDYLQMALGYSLTGHTREEILFYPFGPTRSGKGTFAETFMELLPRPLSTMVDFNSFTAKREGDVSNFDLAPLKPSRLIFASESNRSQSLNPARGSRSKWTGSNV
jgi:D5 N terminal like